MPVVTTVANIGQLPTEAEKIADLKDRAAAAMAAVCAVMDDAVSAGYLLRWQTICTNVYTLRHEVVDLHLEKRY